MKKTIRAGKIEISCDGKNIFLETWADDDSVSGEGCWVLSEDEINDIIFWLRAFKILEAEVTKIRQ